MSLDDRDWYRAEIKRRERFLDAHRLAPGMSEAEIDATIARKSCRRCGLAIAACAGLAAVPWLWLLLIYFPALVSGLRLGVWGGMLR